MDVDNTYLYECERCEKTKKIVADCEEEADGIITESWEWDYMDGEWLCPDCSSDAAREDDPDDLGLLVVVAVLYIAAMWPGG